MLLRVSQGNFRKTCSHEPVLLQRRRHDRLGCGDDVVQMRRTFETLRVNLVDVLWAGRPRGEPAICGANLQGDGPLISGLREFVVGNNRFV